MFSPERQKVVHRIPSASKDDVGMYRCHVITPFDSKDSGPAQLSLRYSKHHVVIFFKYCPAFLTAIRLGTI